MEPLFSFLFKYRPLLFSEGEVVFRASWPGLSLLLLGVVGLAVAASAYLRPRAKAGAADRLVLGLLADARGLRESGRCPPPTGNLVARSFKRLSIRKGEASYGNCRRDSRSACFDTRPPLRGSRISLTWVSRVPARIWWTLFDRRGKLSRVCPSRVWS